uniref:Uncharacterized protein n=1 Tax=Romanomermis culicivorax TaxID=13658 RepID=A0A915IUA3_ROMCU
LRFKKTVESRGITEGDVDEYSNKRQERNRTNSSSISCFNMGKSSPKSRVFVLKLEIEEKSKQNQLCQ